jgi:hypothetical protein
MWFLIWFLCKFVDYCAYHRFRYGRWSLVLNFFGSPRSRVSNWNGRICLSRIYPVALFWSAFPSVGVQDFLICIGQIWKVFVCFLIKFKIIIRNVGQKFLCGIWSALMVVNYGFTSFIFIKLRVVNMHNWIIRLIKHHEKKCI